MKKISIIFLQIVIMLIGISTLIFMLWEPNLEGRNVNATFFEIYFKDPFLAYAYFASISFFVALYQMLLLLGYFRQNIIFSINSVRAFRTIKFCTISIVGFVLAAVTYLSITMRGKDDIAGGVTVGLFIIFISAMVAITATVFERCLLKRIN